MNERIKQLAEQAGGVRRLIMGMRHETFLTDEQIEAFAELIVRECVEQIINRERSDGEWYQDDIFKHFGVEE